MAIAFLGCAHIHTPGFINAIKKRPELKVLWVWDHDPERAKKRATELGAQVSEDVASVCRCPDVNAVVVCSETNRHEELVREVVAAKKDVFIEKPLGITAKDANAMADAIAGAGVKFQTGYFMRGMPPHIFIKQQIDKGTLGKITRVRGSNCHSGALGGWFDKDWRWMADRKQAGVGGFGDLGTHGLDLLIWWMGDIDSVTATLDNGTARYPDCDELGEAIFRFKNGAIGTLAASWDDTANPVSYEICGTEGHIAIVNEQVYFESKHVKGADGKNPWTELPEKAAGGFEAFLDTISGKDAALVPVKDAAYRTTVMSAMYEAAREKKWVPIR